LQLTPEKSVRGHYLLVRRSRENVSDLAYYVVHARREGLTLERRAQVAGRRWAIEADFKMAKQECGLDEDEVRKWPAWYRHITLLCPCFPDGYAGPGAKKRGRGRSRWGGRAGASDSPRGPPVPVASESDAGTDPYRVEVAKTPPTTGTEEPLPAEVEAMNCGCRTTHLQRVIRGSCFAALESRNLNTFHLTCCSTVQAYQMQVESLSASNDASFSEWLWGRGGGIAS